MKLPQTAFILSALCSLFIGKILFAQEPVPTRLTEKISIHFPMQPNKEVMGDAATMYTLRLADSTANLMALVSNLQVQAGLDAATLGAAVLEKEFWDQSAEGFVAQMGPDAKLLKKEMKELNGYDIMELTMERPIPDGSGKNILTIYIIIDDVYSINIGHTNRNGKGDEKIMKAFFDSLKIK